MVEVNKVLLACSVLRSLRDVRVWSKASLLGLVVKWIRVESILELWGVQEIITASLRHRVATASPVQDYTRLRWLWRRDVTNVVVDSHRLHGILLCVIKLAQLGTQIVVRVIPSQFVRLTRVSIHLAARNLVHFAVHFFFGIIINFWLVNAVEIVLTVCWDVWKFILFECKLLSVSVPRRRGVTRLLLQIFFWPTTRFVIVLLSNLALAFLGLILVLVDHPHIIHRRGTCLWIFWIMTFTKAYVSTLQVRQVFGFVGQIRIRSWHRIIVSFAWISGRSHISFI